MEERGAIRGAWRERNESLRFFARFAGTSCEAYLTTGMQLYLPSSNDANAWPVIVSDPVERRKPK